jgi:hypothetical protein
MVTFTVVVTVMVMVLFATANQTQETQYPMPDHECVHMYVGARMLYHLEKTEDTLEYSHNTQGARKSYGKDTKSVHAVLREHERVSK